MRKVLVCVSGSIAAYKAADLVSELVKRGDEVQVLLTQSATEFVRPLVFETLSKRPAYSSLFEGGVSGTEHIRLARWPDLIVAAPASLNMISKLALGLADDLVSTTILASKAKLLIAPAMNTVMWEQPACTQNLATLVSRGAKVISPQSEGVLACGEQGAGKMAEVSTILKAVDEEFFRSTTKDLNGVRLLITGGPTKEPLDAVRYLTNPSTGKMGARLVERAIARGAQVTYVLGIDRGVERPKVGAREQLEVIEVSTAEEMLKAALTRLAGIDAVIATAAVSDYKPESASQSKQKRANEPLSLRLTPTVDVLATLRLKADQKTRFIGFAAETDSPVENAQKKMRSKKLDYVFVNPVARLGDSLLSGFGTDTNSGTLLSKEGVIEEIPLSSKSLVADRILDHLARTHETSPNH